MKALLLIKQYLNEVFCQDYSLSLTAKCSLWIWLFIYSDGSGRTGCYCLLDMVLNRMSKGAKEIDIAATLEHIRDQRMNMVKTKVCLMNDHLAISCF